MIDAILDWLNRYESALSAIAALIVIGTVGAAIGRSWITKNRAATQAGDSQQPVTAPAGAMRPDATHPGPVTDRPSIAVLPFENTSGDPDKEAVADGLTTEIIAGLSANRHLFVIARNSCFTYKGRSVDVRQVAGELGVRYVLEGTVRPRGDRVRVSAQLVDAANGATSWSQRFDVPLDDLFKLDDIVTSEIIAALIPELRRAEAQRARENPVDLNAWARVNAAWLDLQNDLANKTVARRAMQQLEEVLKDEPGFALAHAVLAHACSLALELGQENTEESEPLRTKSLEHSRRAVELDPDDPAIRHLVGAAMSNFRMNEEARRSYQQALDLNPDYAPALASLGVSLIYAGRSNEAVTYIERALRLSPREPQAYHWQSHLALALNILGDPERALGFAKASAERRPTTMGRVALVMAHALLGSKTEADAAARDLQAILPDAITADSFRELLAQMTPDETRRAELVAAVMPHLNAMGMH